MQLSLPGWPALSAHRYDAFCGRHQNGHLSSVSRPLCPLMPPVDTYSPLQLCCSISHPTHAVMGCWLYLATVMVTLVQMRDFYSLMLVVCVKHDEKRWRISARLLFWQSWQFVCKETTTTGDVWSTVICYVRQLKSFFCPFSHPFEVLILFQKWINSLAIQEFSSS